MEDKYAETKNIITVTKRRDLTQIETYSSAGHDYVEWSEEELSKVFRYIVLRSNIIKLYCVKVKCCCITSSLVSNHDTGLGMIVCMWFHHLLLSLHPHGEST